MTQGAAERAVAGGRAPPPRCVLALVLVGLGGTYSAAAHAQVERGRRLVQIDHGPCDRPSLADVATILRVELLNRVVEGPPRGDAYRTALDCTGPLVEISVGVPGGATKSAQANLGGVPTNVHARIVALAIAELVRDIDEEPLPVLPERAPPPLAAPLLTPGRERDGVTSLPSAPRPPSRAVDLEAFAETSNFQLSGPWLAGGGLRVSYAARRLCLGLDTALLTTTERFDLGTAQVFLGYASPTIAWQERWRHAQTRLGAGYALGAARLTGHATDARGIEGTTTGPWSAPYAFAALGVLLGEHVIVEVRGQLGWVTSPVIGDVAGGGEVALKGAWASAQVGIALAL